MSTTNSKNSNNKLNVINFGKHADKVQMFSEKNTSNQRATLYNYPENFNAIEINGKEGKNFRSKLRNQLTQMCGLIGLHYKMKNAESLISEVKKFKEFYKLNFKINDFSINSLTNTKEEKNMLYVTMLEIIKEVNISMTGEKKDKKTPTKKIKKEKIAVTPKEVIAE